jgi:hypothetical protein
MGWDGRVVVIFLYICVQTASMGILHIGYSFK